MAKRTQLEASLSDAGAETIADLLVRIDPAKAIRVSLLIGNQVGPAAQAQVEAAFKRAEERPGQVLGDVLGAFLGGGRRR